LEPGERIFEKAQLFIEKMVPIFRHYQQFVSLGREEVNLIYESQLQEADFREIMARQLKKTVYCNIVHVAYIKMNSMTEPGRTSYEKERLSGPAENISYSP
jgi:hypothetical protein